MTAPTTTWADDPPAAPGEDVMPASAKGPFGIYFGWYNVIIALLAITFVVGSTSYSFGLFIEPATHDLGLSRASMNLGLVLFTVGLALSSPVIGRMLDRAPPVGMIRFCAVLFALTMIAISFCHSPLLIGLLLLGPLAVATTGGAALFGSVLVSRWFSAGRGRAITIMWLGTSLGGMLIFPLNAWLLSVLDWRMAVAAIGVIVGSVLLILSFFVRSWPDDATTRYLARRDAGMHSAGLGWKQVLAQRDFWVMTIPIAMLLGVDSTMLATITPYTIDRGMGLAAAAGLMSTLNASAIAGKLAMAVVADRIDTRILLVLTGLFGVALCTCLVFNPNYPLLMTVALMTGFATGATMPLANVAVSFRFGAPSVGTVMGLMMPVTMIFSMSSVYYVGAVHDRTGSYTVAFWTFAGMCAIAMLILPLVRCRPPAEAPLPVT